MLAYALALSLAPAQARAADTPRLVIEGQGPARSLTSPPPIAARRLLNRVPGGAAVVVTTAAARGALTGMTDLLKLAPGVFMEPVNGGEETRVSIRGSGLQSEGVLGVQFLLDGTPYNEGDGEALLEDFDLSSIRYAEVYRGANALRYGLAALGGAVNLVPETGLTSDRLGVAARFGSFGTLRQDAHAGGSSGRRDWYVSASDGRLTGYRAHSEEQSQRLFLNLGWRASPDLEDRFYLTFGRLDRQLPSPLTKDELAADPRQTDAPSQAQDFHRSWLGLRLADAVAYKTAHGRLDSSLYWSFRGLEDKRFFASGFRQGIQRFASHQVGWRLAFEDRRSRLGGENIWTAGLSPGYESEPDRYYANLAGARGGLIAAADVSSLDLPFFLENVHRLLPPLSLVTGVQYSRDMRALRDRFRNPALGDQSGTRNYDGLSPKVGLVCDLDLRSQAFLNLSRSYQPPSFDQLTSVAPGATGGLVFSPLAAQTASTAEAGTRGEEGALKWDVALYRSWIRGELLELNDARGNPLGTVNAGRTVHQGVETGLTLRLAESLSLTQSYTLSDFHFAGDPVYGHGRVAGIPPHLYRAEFDYEHPSGFHAGPELEWSLSRYPVDHADTLFADPYALVGFTLGYAAKRGPSAFFEARNLAGKVYAATVTPIADARTEDSLEVFRPGNGRAFYGGLSWTW